jgi:hypothetical protein
MPKVKRGRARQPKTRFSWLPLPSVLGAEPYAAALGISEGTRAEGGFVRAYEEAGGLRGLDEAWLPKREAFLAHHTVRMLRDDEPLWDADGAPTPRHLVLIMWGHSPRPAALKRWLVDVGLGRKTWGGMQEGQDMDQEEQDQEEQDQEEQDQEEQEEADPVRAQIRAVLLDYLSEGDADLAARDVAAALADEDAPLFQSDDMDREAVASLEAACRTWTGKDGECEAVHVNVEGDAIELGRGAYLAFVEYAGGAARPVLGYDIPDTGRAYYHQLAPGTRVLVLGGAIVLQHPGLVLTPGGVDEGEDARRIVGLLGQWALTVYACDKDGEEEVLDGGRFTARDDAVDYLRDCLEAIYVESVHAALKAELQLEADGEATFPGGVRVVLVQEEDGVEE